MDYKLSVYNCDNCPLDEMTSVVESRVAFLDSYRCHCNYEENYRIENEDGPHRRTMTKIKNIKNWEIEFSVLSGGELSYSDLDSLLDELCKRIKHPATILTEDKGLIACSKY